jgi:hypothetical protein
VCRQRREKKIERRGQVTGREKNRERERGKERCERKERKRENFDFVIGQIFCDRIHTVVCVTVISLNLIYPFLILLMIRLSELVETNQSIFFKFNR